MGCCKSAPKDAADSMRNFSSTMMGKRSSSSSKASSSSKGSSKGQSVMHTFTRRRRMQAQAKRNYDHLMSTLQGHVNTTQDDELKASIQISLLKLKESKVKSIMDLQEFSLTGLNMQVEVRVTQRRKTRAIDSALKGVSLVCQAAGQLEEEVISRITNGKSKAKIITAAAEKAGVMHRSETTLDSFQVALDVDCTITVASGGSDVTVALKFPEDADIMLDGVLEKSKAESCVRDALMWKVQKEVLEMQWKAVDPALVKAARGTAKFYSREKPWATPPGRNQYIRKRMDYSYFAQVSDERVAWQDELIASKIFVEQSLENHQRLGSFSLPWVVYSAGGMGAGKGHVIKWMTKQGYLPEKSFVFVDPDSIRKLLPEWDGITTQYPEEAGYLTQMEATNIADIVSKKALMNRFCVFIDGSLRATDWYKNTEFPLLRKLFPGIRIMIIHVLAEPEQECVLRAQSRAEVEGRAVPPDMISGSIHDSARSVGELSMEADFVVRVVNRTGEDPELQPVVVEGMHVNPSPELLQKRGGWKLLQDCFQPLNTFEDRMAALVATKGSSTKGYLSKSTLQAAIARGVLTQRVVDSIDFSGDGYIVPDELAKARQAANEWGSLYDLMEGESDAEDVVAHAEVADVACGVALEGVEIKTSTNEVTGEVLYHVEV